MARMGVLLLPILDWNRIGRLKSDLPVSLTGQGQTAAWSLSSWSRYFSGMRCRWILMILTDKKCRLMAGVHLSPISATAGFSIVSARTLAVTHAYFASKDLPRNWLRPAPAILERYVKV